MSGLKRIRAWGTKGGFGCGDTFVPGISGKQSGTSPTL